MARRKKNTTGPIMAGFVAIVGALAVMFGDKLTEFSTAFLNGKESTEEIKVTPVNLDGTLQVYFVDVGQADSILIRDDSGSVLIDAGNNEDGKKLVEYYKSLGITEFKYVIGTHAHEDHIGGMDDIINAFNITTFYMPAAMTTTATFEDVLDALDAKNMAFNTTEIDSTFKVGDAEFTVVYTGTDTSDLNNTSIVLKLKYGNNTFLFMGDATSKVEKIILDKDIKADLLKVGHHGSQYSSTDAFLDKVNPKYAVIEVGKNNTYDHPKDVTLNKLSERNIQVHRTDEEGTILVTSDGNDLTFKNFVTDTNG